MQRASSSQTKVNHPAYKLDLLAYDSLRITFANAFELDSTSRFDYRTSIKGPISVPLSPSNAVKCYPCREVPLNYNRSLLFHGGDTGSTPVRDAKILKNTSNLGIKEHLRSSSRGSSARLFPTPAMVEVDLRSSSGEALKHLGYPFEDAAEVRSFTANRRAQVRGPAGPRPAPHPVRASVVQPHQPDVRFGSEKREVDHPVI